MILQSPIKLRPFRSHTLNNDSLSAIDPQKEQQYRNQIEGVQQNIDNQLEKFQEVCRDKVKNSSNLLISSFVQHNKKIANELKSVTNKLNEKNIEVEKQNQIQYLQKHLEFFRNQAHSLNQENLEQQKKIRELKTLNQDLRNEINAKDLILQGFKDKMKTVEEKINSLLIKHQQQLNQNNNSITPKINSNSRSNSSPKHNRSQQQQNNVSTFTIKLMDLKQDLNSSVLLQNNNNNSSQNINLDENNIFNGTSDLFSPISPILLKRKRQQQQQQKIQNTSINIQLKNQNGENQNENSEVYLKSIHLQKQQSSKQQQQQNISNKKQKYEQLQRNSTINSENNIEESQHNEKNQQEQNISLKTQIIQCLNLLEEKPTQQQKVVVIYKFTEQLQKQNLDKIKYLDKRLVDLKNFIEFKAQLQKSKLDKQELLLKQDQKPLNSDQINQKFIDLWIQCINDVQNDIMIRQLKMESKQNQQSFIKKKCTTNISNIQNLQLENGDRQILVERFFQRNEKFIQYIQNDYLQKLKNKEIIDQFAFKNDTSISLQDLQRNVINDSQKKQSQFQNNKLIRSIKKQYYLNTQEDDNNTNDLSDRNKKDKETEKDTEKNKKDMMKQDKFTVSFSNLNPQQNGHIQTDMSSPLLQNKIKRGRINHQIERSKRLTNFYNSIQKNLNYSSFN